MDGQHKVLRPPCAEFLLVSEDSATYLVTIPLSNSVTHLARPGFGLDGMGEVPTWPISKTTCHGVSSLSM